jgi:hypothetical protein
VSEQLIQKMSGFLIAFRLFDIIEKSARNMGFALCDLCQQVHGTSFTIAVGTERRRGQHDTS